MVAVRYDDLSLAIDFVSGGPPVERNAYISIDTGQIYWTSELNPTEEEVPDDLETSDRYSATLNRPMSHRPHFGWYRRTGSVVLLFFGVGRVNPPWPRRSSPRAPTSRARS